MGSVGPFGIDYTHTSTVQEFGLGDLSWGKNGLFQYVQANGAITAYDAVKVDNDGQAAPLTTAISAAEPTAVGAAQVAFADNEYGWVFRGFGGGLGKGIKVRVLIAMDAANKLYTTITPGVLDDAATDCVQNVAYVTTNASGATEAGEIYAVGMMVTNCQD